MKPDRTFFREVLPDEIKLINHERSILRNYAQMVNNARGFLGVYLQMLFEMQIKANSLLLFLEKEYKLK